MRRDLQPAAGRDKRDRLKQAALRLGVGVRLRDLKRAFEPQHVSRDRRDNDQLRAVLAAVLAPDSDCIDVGAHRGSVLSELVRLAPQGRHIAYEPLPHLAAALRRRYPGVDVRQAALSDSEGEAPFVHVVSNPGWSGLRERPYPGGQGQISRIVVRLECLDESLPSDCRPAFIKIDVEGAEEQVLRGAMNTLRRHRPLLALEHGLGSADVYGTPPEAIFRLLVEQAQMRVFDMDGGGPYTPEEFAEVYHSGKRVNFLIRP